MGFPCLCFRLTSTACRCMEQPLCVRVLPGAKSFGSARRLSCASQLGQNLLQTTYASTVLRSGAFLACRPDQGLNVRKWATGMPLDFIWKNDRHLQTSSWVSPNECPCHQLENARHAFLGDHGNHMANEHFHVEDSKDKAQANPEDEAQAPCICYFADILIGQAKTKLLQPDERLSQCMLEPE